MNKIPFTNSIGFSVVDDCDFERVSAFKWMNIGGYAIRTTADENGKRVTMQNFVLGVTGMVDHKDGVKSNNVRSNLRPCTRSQNGANSNRNNRSGYRGVKVDRRTGCISASISVDGRQKYLGAFSSAEVAARAYDDAAIDAFGEFARLNFPSEK